MRPFLVWVRPEILSLVWFFIYLERINGFTVFPIGKNLNMTIEFLKTMVNNQDDKDEEKDDAVRDAAITH